MYRNKLLLSAMSISSIRFVSQFIMFIVGILISSQFGATTSTDSYYTALILPGALGNLIVSVLANLFAPIYLAYLKDHPQEQSHILGSLNFVALLGLTIGVFISALFVPIFTNGRQLADAASVQTALIFGFSLVVLCPLVGFSRLLAVYCETHQHYTIVATAAVLNTLSALMIIVLTANSLDIYSLLIANIISQIVEFGVLLFYCTQRLRLILRLYFDIHPAVKEMVTASMLPAIGYIALFFVPTIDRSMISTFPGGQLTAYNYGERLVLAVETILLGGPVLIIYYHWVNQATKAGIQSTIATADQVFSLMNYIFIPLCVGGASISRPLLSIIFERGAFAGEQVTLSAAVFSILLISQIFNYTIVLSIRLLLLEKQILPQAIVAIIISLLNLVLNLLLASVWGLLGIVFSTLFTRMIAAGLSIWYVKRYFPLFHIRRLLKKLTYSLLATFVMVLSVLGVQFWLQPALTRAYGLISQIIAVFIIVVIGMLIYALLTILFRHPDAKIFLDILMQTPLKPVIRYLR